MTSINDLRKLSNIINGAIDRIEGVCKAQGLDFPSLDTPFTRESESVREIPEVYDATNLITSAAGQLAAIARSPAMMLIDVSFKYFQGTALKIVLEADVAEYLRVHGPSVAPSVVLPRLAASLKARRTPVLLFASLKDMLASEIAPDVFANNRLSSLLDSGSSLEVLTVNRTAKFNGLPAYLDLNLEFGAQAAKHLPQVLFDPATAHSLNFSDAALPRSYNFEGSYFQFVALPENKHHLDRLSAAMDSLTAVTSPDAVLEGFKWGDLADNSVVVDVAGGEGSQSLILARKFPHLQLIVQEREEVIKRTERFWEGQGMGHTIDTKRVELQEHDIFSPQPVKAAAVFYMRAVLLDWPDEYCVRILRNLHNAAMPTTRLVLQDIITFHACPDPATEGFKQGLLSVPPEPILPNWGKANSYPYYLDMVVMSNFHARSRTVAEFTGLLDQAGWLLEDLRHGSLHLALANQTIIARPRA